MNLDIGTRAALFFVMFCCASPVYAQSPPVEQRELIYCADQMTHEERETYRAKMRTARTAEEKALIRQAHQQEMQKRGRLSGKEAQCEPLRLRRHEGRGQ